MTETTHEIEYDEYGGWIVIDGTKYDASTLNAEPPKEIDKALHLSIIVDGGEEIYFESRKRSLFKNQGDIAETINEIYKKLPSLKKRAAYRKLREAVARGYMPRCEAPVSILMKKGEICIFCESDVDFSQERTQTRYAGTSARVKVSKNLSLGGFGGAPIKTESFIHMDTGELVLTNKRVIFVGERKSIVIPINKISAVERWRNAMDISKESVVRQFRFYVDDGNLWADMISAVYNELEGI